MDTARLQTISALSIKEALRTMPGVHVVDEDAFGLNLNIGVRALAPRRSQRVLLLEDGMPIHLGPYSDPSAHYHPPVDALERIDLVTGPSQIAFGPQTVGGVINFVRRAPPQRPEARLALSGGDREYRAGRLSLGGTWRGRGAVLDLARRAGDGTRRGHAHLIDDLSLRSTLPLGMRQRATLSLGSYREASRYGEAGLSQDEYARDPYQNPLPNDVFDLRRRAVQGVHELVVGQHATVRTQLYHQRVARTAWRQASTSADRIGNAAYERTFRCAPGASTVNECGNTGRPRRYSFGGAETRLLVGHAGREWRGTLEAGVRVHDELMRRQERDGATATARDGPLTRDNEVRTRAASAFLLQQFSWRGVAVTPGIRWEQVWSTNRNRLAATRASDHYAEVLPGIGLTWTPGDTSRGRVTLVAGVHRGFAPPRPADVLNPVPGEGIVQVEAETSVMTEAGARMQFGAAGRLQVMTFHLAFDNQVVRGALVGLGQRYVNAGRARHAGLEVDASFSISRLIGDRWPTAAGSLESELAWTFVPIARFHDDRTSTVEPGQSVLGRRLPFAPRSVSHAGLVWRQARGAHLRIDADAVSSQYSDDVNSIATSAQGRRGLIPAYHVIHASARRSLVGGSRDAALTVSLKNVLNRTYITDRQEGIMTGSPRTMLVGLDLSF